MLNPFKTYSELWTYASGTFLTVQVPVEVFEGSEDDLVDFVNDHAWQPFEEYPAQEVIVNINTLAEDIVRTFEVKFEEDK